MALTFDMGGRIGDALAIVNYLVSHQVNATIFPTGAIVDSTATDAGRQVLGIVQGHPAQLTLANHSYTHPSFTTITQTQMADELRRTEVAFAKYCTRTQSRSSGRPTAHTTRPSSPAWARPAIR